MKVVNLVKIVVKHVGIRLIGDFVLVMILLGRNCFTCKFGKHFFCKLGGSAIFCRYFW